MSIHHSIPYESEPIRGTHPDHLYCIGRLMGMEPATLARARVVELGCANATNLLALAYAYPQSEFIGVERTERDVKSAKTVIAQLGLKNIDIRRADLLDLTAEQLGPCDYILCHGVFSWVPAGVRDRILQLCGNCLTAHGIAYLSYNTMPGWHLRGMIREAMLFEASFQTEFDSKVDAAANALRFLSELCREVDTPYTRILRDELPIFQKMDPWYWAHDAMAEVNQPFYFYEVADLAGRVGLQYLGDADLAKVIPHELNQNAQRLVATRARDLVRREHYLDLIRNRFFRASLFCRMNLELSRKMNDAVLDDMWVASPLTVPQNQRNAPTGVMTFLHPNGGALTCQDVLGQRALMLLEHHWPASVMIREMYTQVIPPELSSEQYAQAMASIRVLLLRAYLSGLLEIQATPRPCARNGGEQPVASALARFQARYGAKVSSLRHEALVLGEDLRGLLQLLDGSKTISELEAICGPSCRALIDQIGKLSLLHTAPRRAPTL